MAAGRTLHMDDKPALKNASERFFDHWQRKSRFAVEGPNGRFSTAWAAWDNSGSVYVAGRTLGGFMKVSLHEEGGYRFAFTKEFHPKIKERSDKFRSRELAVWPKPKVCNDRADLIVSICFPTDNLVSNPPPSSPKKPYLILQTPRLGRAVNVGFFISGAPTDKLEQYFSQYGKAFCHWDFRDGTSISMVAWESEFDRSSLPKPGPTANLVPLTDSGRIDVADYQSDLTALLWNDPVQTGTLQMIELGGVSLPHGIEINEL